MKELFNTMNQLFIVLNNQWLINFFELELK